MVLLYTLGALVLKPGFTNDSRAQGSLLTNDSRALESVLTNGVRKPEAFGHAHESVEHVVSLAFMDAPFLLPPPRHGDLCLGSLHRHPTSPFGTLLDGFRSDWG